MCPVYTPEEVAELLRVHLNTVYRLLRSGSLPAAKTGRDWRIPGSALDDFLHGRLSGNPAVNHGNRPLPEDRVWLEADGSGLGEVEPYDWGPLGIPKGKPIRYIPGVGPVIASEEGRWLGD